MQSSKRNRHYGISKGSQPFPFRETIIDVNAISFDQAQVDYDSLVKQRTKLIRVIAKWAEDQTSPITDIPESVMLVKAQINDIEHNIMTLIEQYPEVER